MKIRTVILAALLGLVAVNNSTAQSIIDGGGCGKQGYNLMWYLYSDSTLIIYGSGDMEDFTSMIPEAKRPWDYYRDLIKTVIIGDSVTSIGISAFAPSMLGNHSFTSVIIGNGVTSIGGSAFAHCYGLTSITIPESVTSIEDLAFGDCINLSSLTIYAVTPPVLILFPSSPYGTGVFLNVPKTIPVYVPCEAVPAYRDSAGWSDFNNYIGMGFTDTTFIFDTVCYGAVYNDNDFNITEGSGIYYRTMPSIYNCDSVICLTLAEYPFVPITQYADTIYYGETYDDANFTGLTDAGTYYDTLQTINDCDSIIELTLIVTGVGIAEASYELQVTSYEIYNMVGQLLLSLPSLRGTQCRSNPEIIDCFANARNDVNLPQGIYFIKLQTNKGTITKKLIKN